MWVDHCDCPSWEPFHRAPVHRARLHAVSAAHPAPLPRRPPPGPTWARGTGDSRSFPSRARLRHRPRIALPRCLGWWLWADGAQLPAARPLRHVEAPRSCTRPGAGAVGEGACSSPGRPACEEPWPRFPPRSKAHRESGLMNTKEQAVREGGRRARGPPASTEDGGGAGGEALQHVRKTDRQREALAGIGREGPRRVGARGA